MGKSALKVGVLVFFAGLAFGAHPVNAQLNNSWVSQSGNDLSPCDRTNPCLTFAAAIARTNPRGEINVYDSGDFGPVTITKSITIDGGGTFASIGAVGVNAIVVSAGANDRVVLRNLSLNGYGTGLNGIRFLSGRFLTIDRVDISSFVGNGVDMAHSGAGTLVVKDSSISSVARGIRMTAAGGFSIASIRTVSIFAAGAGGLELASGNTVATVFDSAFTGNGGPAVGTLGGNGVINVKSSVLSHNAVGVSAGSAGSLIRLTNNAIQNNTIGFSLVGGATIATAGENKTGGNGGAGAPNGLVTLE
jgi:hypothetical protein